MNAHTGDIVTDTQVYYCIDRGTLDLLACSYDLYSFLPLRLKEGVGGNKKILSKL